MKFISGYLRLIDSFNETIGRLTSWLTFILVLVVSYDVVVRYIFDTGSVALQEVEWHIFALIFLLAAGYTLKIDEHVRVDVFYTNFTEKKKAWINLLGSILFLVPFCIIVILSSENFLYISFRVNETSPDAGGLPARYLLKAVIPFSFFLLLLQGVAAAFRSIIIIMKKESTIGTQN